MSTPRRIAKLSGGEIVTACAEKNVIRGMGRAWNGRNAECSNVHYYYADTFVTFGLLKLAKYGPLERLLDGTSKID
jgi:hypothetical protein